MKSRSALVALALGALSLGACQSMGPHENRVLTGAGLGGAGGAIIGGVTSGTAGGAVVGGAVGAMAGAVIADVTSPYKNGRPTRCYTYDAYNNKHWVPCN